MKLTLAQVAHGAGGEIHSRVSAAADSVEATGYSIDSRTLQPGDLFFAIHGERFDGHDFIIAAFGHGACAAVIARSRLSALPEPARQHPLVLVDDPLAALQRLAAFVRRHSASGKPVRGSAHGGLRVVGITGSAGKTTTKEAVAAVLSTSFRVLKSQGNLNNGYGLPLQLLRLEPAHEIAVVEMGMSAAGEIAALCRIAAPDWGVVTNVGNAHAENFPDGIAGIARAKYELVAALPRNGVAFLNCDDHYVSQFGRDFAGKVVYFGRGPCAAPRAVRMESLGADGMRVEVRAADRSCTLHLRLLGEHNVANAMAAIAVGIESGIPLELCCAALEQLEPGDQRGQVLTSGGATIINDSYNSNPEALRSMIAMLAGMPAQRRILIAGEMLELGPGAEALHTACGKAAAAAGINIVLGVRGHARQIVEAARAGGCEAQFLETPEAAGQWLRHHLQPGDAVLLKASRGVRLERTLEALPASEKDKGSAQPGAIR